jgi:hypothetical protein
MEGLERRGPLPEGKTKLVRARRAPAFVSSADCAVYRKSIKMEQRLGQAVGHAVSCPALQQCEDKLSVLVGRWASI